MKPSLLLACSTLLSLGCGGELPAPTAPASAAPAQRPAEVTTVDLSPPPPPAAPVTKVVAPAPEVVAKTPEELQAQRQSALKEAADYGMLGLLSTGDPNAPTAPWGKDDAATDPLSAHGNMWGDAIGDSFGAGGLGLTGTGPSGGGRGEGIGLGSIGTLGHSAGTGTGQGFGSGNGRLGGAHRGNPPKIKMGATSVAGRLPPEVIQRIVRQNFGRFRLCYENGLRTNPKLEGMVTVRFVIENSGVVSGISTAKGTDVKDKGMTKCLETAFTNLSFPQPEGGKVTVSYPLLFSPADPDPVPTAKAPAPPAAPAAPKSP